VTGGHEICAGIHVMSTKPSDAPVEVFATCPSSNDADPDVYLRQMIDVARWSDQHGCKGILIYSDNSQLDAWLLSHIIIEHTRTLCPLVAVQPVYMHPYTVAKMLTSIAHLHRRRIYLNMVAGGFKNDLNALSDTTPHDKRYARLAEYVQIIKSLVDGPAAVSFEGEFYRIDKLKLTPPLDADLYPGIFVSGSSDAGLEAARAIGATAIKYPKPASEEEVGIDAGMQYGIRVGIIARRKASDAWAIARARFPEDRRGQLTRQLASKISDSVWHQQLAAVDERNGASPYWLVPFQNYKTMCPYLVGSYDEVAEELARYFAAGYRTVILDVPPSADELQHTFRAVNLAMQPVQ
jgi:alkanesulfonate monooxygenase